MTPLARLLAAVKAGDFDATPERPTPKFNAFCRAWEAAFDYAHSYNKGWAAYQFKDANAAIALRVAMLPDGSGNGGSSWSISLVLDRNDHTGAAIWTANVHDGSSHTCCDIAGCAHIRAQQAAPPDVMQAARVLLADGAAFAKMVEAAEFAHGIGVSFNRVVGDALRVIAEETP